MVTPRVAPIFSPDAIDIYGDIRYHAVYMTIFLESVYAKWKCDSPIERGKEFNIM